MKLIHWTNSKVRGSTGLRCLFRKKALKKKHLYCYDKKYDYFLKSNVPVVSVMKDSRNKIGFSKHMSL